jgi:hypothetical protein
MAGTTTNYGWTYPTSTDLVKDGATAIQTATQGVDTTLWTALGGAYPGLRLVKKQVIGSGVSSVNVTSAFSATYEAYKIVVTGGVASTSPNLGLKLGASATGYYEVLRYNTFSTGAAQTPAGTNNGSSWAFVGNASTDAIAFDVNLRNPFLAKWTYFDSYYIATGTTGNDSGVHQVATSYTDFTITPSAGTLTGGTIYVYGYGIS